MEFELDILTAGPRHTTRTNTTVFPSRSSQFSISTWNVLFKKPENSPLLFSLSFSLFLPADLLIRKIFIKTSFRDDKRAKSSSSSSRYILRRNAKLRRRYFNARYHVFLLPLFHSLPCASSFPLSLSLSPLPLFSRVSSYHSFRTTGKLKGGDCSSTKLYYTNFTRKASTSLS